MYSTAVGYAGGTTPNPSYRETCTGMSGHTQAVQVVLDSDRAAAEQSRKNYQASLSEAGYGEITTEIAPPGPFFYAEPDHQQYLAKNPGGYCNHGFCQVSSTEHSKTHPLTRRIPSEP